MLKVAILLGILFGSNKLPLPKELRPELTVYSFMEEMNSYFAQNAMPTKLSVVGCNGPRLITCHYKTDGNISIKVTSIPDTKTASDAYLLYCKNSTVDEFEYAFNGLVNVVDPQITDAGLWQIMDDTILALDRLDTTSHSFTYKRLRYSATIQSGCIWFRVIAK